MKNFSKIILLALTLVLFSCQSEATSQIQDSISSTAKNVSVTIENAQNFAHSGVENIQNTYETTKNSIQSGTEMINAGIESVRTNANQVENMINNGTQSIKIFKIHYHKRKIRKVNFWIFLFDFLA